MRGLLRRWLTRPSRLPRWLRGTLALLLGAGAALGIAAPASPASGTTPAVSRPSGALPLSKQAPGKNFTRSQARQQAGQPNFQHPTKLSVSQIKAKPTKRPLPPGPGNPVKTFPDSAMLRAQGYTLYSQSCASCHGLNLQGIRNVAPSLIDVGAGPMDFFLSTGRMPLANPHEEPMRAKPVYSREQIDALIDYVVSSGGGPWAPTADPSKGDLGTGQQEFTLNCAGCHQELARGGMVVGAFVPSLLHATAQQVAEAVRFGPYLMPHFDSKQINQYELDSIAKYVLYTQHPDNAGGWGIYNIGPIPEGLVAWFMGLAALMIVARLIGERTA